MRRVSTTVLVLIVAAALASNRHATVVAQSADKDDPSKPVAPKDEETQLTGLVVDPAGAPAAGITVVGGRRDWMLTRNATTDAAGHFSLTVPKEMLAGFRLVAQNPDESLMAVHRYAGGAGDPQAETPGDVTIALKPSVTVAVEVNDGQGRPIESAHVCVIADNQRFAHRLSDAAGKAVAHLPADLTLRTVYAWKPATGFDYHHFFDPQKARNNEPQDAVDLSQPVRMTLSDPLTLRVRLVDADSGQPIPGVDVYPWLFRKPSEPEDFNTSFAAKEFNTATNDEGVAVLDWLPRWDENRQLQIWPVTRDYHRARGSYEYATGDGTLTMKLAKLVPMRGRVTFPDGSPAAGASVVVTGESYAIDSYRMGTQTDDDGRYEIKIAPNYLYLSIASFGGGTAEDKQAWASAPRDGFVSKPNTPLENLDFTLRPATRIFGRVTMGPEQEPVAGQYISLYQHGQDLHSLKDVALPNPENSRKYVHPMMVYSGRTDADGRYEFFVGPGNFDVRGPKQASIEKFAISDEVAREVNFQAAREEKGTLAGLVVTGDTLHPAAGVRVEGIYRHPLAGRDLSTVTGPDGRFKVTRELHRMVIHAFTPDKEWGGVVEIAPDAKTTIIVMQAHASASGRLLDAETKQPLVDREIIYGVRVPIGEDENSAFQTSFGGHVRTDAEGRFRITGLILEQPYEISVTIESRRSWRNVGKIRPTSAEETDLHDLVLVPDFRPPTLKERIASSFRKGVSAEERYRTGLRDTQIGHLKLLVIFADPASPATQSLYNLRFEDNDVRRALDNYMLLSLPTTGDLADSSAELAKRLGVPIAADALPLIVIRSSDDEPVAAVSIQEISTDGEIDKAKLVTLLDEHAMEILDARQLLSEALKRAEAENKRVFVQESATWCGPCWLLSRFWDRHRELFEKDYLLVKVDHRWANHVEVMQTLRDDKPRGIPWFAILDTAGNVLANSDGPDGNIGYPSNAEGIDHFLAALEKTRLQLTDADLSTIRTALEEAK